MHVINNMLDDDHLEPLGVCWTGEELMLEGRRHDIKSVSGTLAQNTP